MTAEQQLERSVLESKERDELHAIAQALSVKTNTRTKKADIIDGILLVLERDEAVGEAFNIGNPRSTLTIYNLAREVIRLAQSSSVIEMVDWPYADVELRIPDVGKARRLLGFEPRIDLEEGLLKTIEWYRRRN